MNRNAEEIWEEYNERLKRRRLSEAAIVWAEMESAGITPDEILALDFSHFSSKQNDAESLAAQLSENYQIEVSSDPRSEYWFVNGTTRPYGVTLDEGQHNSWVEFMVDVARSHSCVFTCWVIEAPELGKAFSSESIASDDEQDDNGRR